MQRGKLELAPRVHIATLPYSQGMVIIAPMVAEYCLHSRFSSAGSPAVDDGPSTLAVFTGAGIAVGAAVGFALSVSRMVAQPPSLLAIAVPEANFGCFCRCRACCN